MTDTQKQRLEKVIANCINHGYGDSLSGLTEPTKTCKEFASEQVDVLSKMIAEAKEETAREISKMAEESKMAKIIIMPNTPENEVKAIFFGRVKAFEELIEEVKYTYLLEIREQVAKGKENK